MTSIYDQLRHERRGGVPVTPRAISDILFDHVYMEPRVALWELNQRRKDIELKSDIRTNLGSTAVPVLKKFAKARAVLFRQLGTPTHETLRFLRMAKMLHLDPLILEYLDDKFVSAGNRYKRSLGKLPIYQFTGSDGVDNVKYRNICDFSKHEGKRLAEVNCTDGSKMVEIHHALLQKVAAVNPKTRCFDASAWFHHINSDSRADTYYESVLSLFLRDGILFENYFTTQTERPFVQHTIIPAIDKIVARYRKKPIIVRLLPQGQELRLFWDSFPKKTERFLDEMLSS